MGNLPILTPSPPNSIPQALELRPLPQYKSERNTDSPQNNAAVHPMKSNNDTKVFTLL
jgi:hypothetical protein